jgi:DNA-binding response OmpR family regulator
VRILVVEDDRKVANFIQSGSEGLRGRRAMRGATCGRQANALGHDAVVLGLMLPAVRVQSCATSGRGASCRS